jgi:hypothetical protein
VKRKVPIMEEVLKVGMLGCTITVAYLGYCQIRSFFDAITSKQEFTSDRSCDGDVILNNAEQPCQHDWSTCLTDLSGHNWYDEVVEAEDVNDVVLKMVIAPSGLLTFAVLVMEISLLLVDCL